MTRGEAIVGCGRDAMNDAWAAFSIGQEGAENSSYRGALALTVAMILGASEDGTFDHDAKMAIMGIWAGLEYVKSHFPNDPVDEVIEHGRENMIEVKRQMGAPRGI